MALSRPRIWVPHRQPSWPLSIDRRNPLTRGLIAAWPFLPPGGNTLYDVGGYGLHGALTNMDPANDWSGTSRGMSLHFDGQTGSFVDVSPSAGSLSAIEGSVGLVVRFEEGSESDGVARALLEFGNDTDGDNFVGWRKTTSNDLVMRYRQAAANTDATIGVIPGNTWLHVVGAWDSTSVYAYLDGFEAHSAARGTDISVPLNQGALAGQGQGPGSAKGDKVPIASVTLAYAYSRALSAREVARLHVNPWQLFRSVLSTVLGTSPSKPALNYYLGGISVTKRVQGRGIGW